MLKTKVIRMFNTADEMTKGVISTGDTNILEAMANMDERTAAMIIPMCRLYADYKAYALEMADMMDSQREAMDLLVEQNKVLLEQVKHLQEEADSMKGINKE